MKRSFVAASAACASLLAQSLASTRGHLSVAAASPAAQGVVIDTSGVDRAAVIDIVVHAASGPVTARVTMLRGENYPIRADVRPGSGQTRVVVVFAGARPPGDLSLIDRVTDRVRARVEVTAPAADGLTTNLRDGQTTVTGLAGPLSLESQNGQILVQHAGATVTVHTNNGSLEVDGAGASVDASTDNGQVTIADAAGAVTAHADNGSVSVLRPGGNVDARTERGQVTATLIETHVSNVVLQTGIGSIVLRVPRGFAPPVDAHTDLGNVDDPGPQGSGPGTVRLRTNLGSIQIIRG